MVTKKICLFFEQKELYRISMIQGFQLILLILNCKTITLINIDGVH